MFSFCIKYSTVIIWYDDYRVGFLLTIFGSHLTIKFTMMGKRGSLLMTVIVSYSDHMKDIQYGFIKGDERSEQ